MRATGSRAGRLQKSNISGDLGRIRCVLGRSDLLVLKRSLSNQRVKSSRSSSFDTGDFHSNRRRRRSEATIPAFRFSKAYSWKTDLPPETFRVPSTRSATDSRARFSPSSAYRRSRSAIVANLSSTPSGSFTPARAHMPSTAHTASMLPLRLYSAISLLISASRRTSPVEAGGIGLLDFVRRIMPLPKLLFPTSASDPRARHKCYVIFARGKCQV